MTTLTDRARPELAACPFCGGEAEFVGPDARTLMYVRCAVCRAAAPWEHAGHGGTSEEAVAAWNRRTPDPAILAAEKRGAAREREALMGARREVWNLGLTISEIAKWPRFYFNRLYVEEWAIRTAAILHRWGMDFEAVLTVHGHKQIKNSRLTKPETAAAIRNRESDK